MTADTTQPAGALPEPIGHLHSDGDFCLDRAIPEPTLWPVDLCLAEDLRAMMAERDAAREEAAGLRAELAQRNKSPSDRLHNLCAAIAEDADKSPFSREAWDELEAEAAALRRELEELRAQKPVANVISEDEPETVDAGFVDWIGRVALKSGTRLYARPIPPDAREPLTPERVEALWNEDALARIHGHEPCRLSHLEFAKAIQRAQGIGPVGTSADGETQHG